MFYVDATQDASHRIASSPFPPLTPCCLGPWNRQSFFALNSSRSDFGSKMSRSHRKYGTEDGRCVCTMHWHLTQNRRYSAILDKIDSIMLTHPKKNLLDSLKQPYAEPVQRASDDSSESNPLAFGETLGGSVHRTCS